MTTVPQKSNDRRPDLVVVSILLAVAAVVFTKDITVGGLRFGDASSHAMDGVLIRDWIAAGAGAWISPMEFAARQYAHYPTLGIWHVYPPGFAIVESLFFALFGVSAFSARLCAAGFGLLAVLGCYKLSRRMMTPLGAACATGFLISAPGIVFWTRQAKVEMPTLAVLIWAVLAAAWYVERPSWRRWLPVTALILSAPFFKQQGIFIVPVLGMAFLVFAWRKRIPRKQFLAAAVVVLLPLSAFFYFLLFFGGSATHSAKVVGAGKPFSEWLSWEQISYYPQTLPRWLGWPMLTLAGMGVVSAVRRLDWRWNTILLWLVVFFTMVVLIQHNEDRYFFFGYFPITMLAGLAVGTLLGILPIGRLRPIVAAIAIGASVWSGYATPIRYEPDYAPLIAAHEARIRGKIVLFEGLRDGDFIFAARKHLGVRKCVIVRGSKVFYSCANDPRFDFTSYVSSRQDVRKIIDEFGFQTLFVERRNIWNLPEIDLLHAELAVEDRYERIDSWNLTVPKPGQEERSRIVDIYRVKDPSSRRLRFVNIPVPIAGRNVQIDLDALLSPEA